MGPVLILKATSSLGAEEWQAEIYSDPSDQRAALSTTRTDASEVLSQAVARNGGFAIRLTPVSTDR
jgi:hypothetical protein